jgi:hypothetical protein
LIDGLKNPTVVTSDAARREFTIRPRDLRTAIRDAIQSEDTAFAGKRWADLADVEDLPRRYGGKTEGTRLVDHRHAVVSVAPERAFAAIERIGGPNGWYACDWLWQLRGWMDRMMGGPRDGDVTIHQTAVFDPKGLGGLAYWYAIWPLHELVFRRMLAGIVRHAVRA